MATDKTQTLNALKTKILTESLNNEGRNKYGLFSYAPAGVSGNGNYNFNKTKTLGPDGKPKTQPRGLFSGPTSSGKVESSFFSKTAYVTIGDKYVDPASRDRQYNNAKKQKIRHESEFKPADGKVVIPNRNIMTNPPKAGHGDSTIGHLMNAAHKHMAEPYNRAQELAAKEREEHKKKLQEASFKTVSHGNNLFATTKKTFGKDENVLEPGNPKARAGLPKLHENPFRPSNPAKMGYNKTLGKFPDYKADPIKVAVRKIVDPSQKKDAFKPNSTADYERPTPSISLNKANLKNEMARISASLV